MIEILHVELGALGRGDLLRVVAISATNACVFAVKHKSGLRVIKAFRRGIPFYDFEIFAIVFGMALDAGRRGRARSEITCVQAASLLNARRNVTVTLEASEVWGARRNGVALGATRWTIQVLMRFGQRSGRNLREASRRKQQ
jgi:hypothetical protein